MVSEKGKGKDIMSDKDYEKILNDIYGNINICGYEWPAGYVFKEIDPIAFEIGKGEYESEVENEIK